MIISIIAALANNNLIGSSKAKNGLPWHLPADLEHFQKLTRGKPIIMGQTTFQFIGKALPGRLNIVLSRDESFQPEGALVAHSIEEALKIAKQSAQGRKTGEVMICGGKSVYEQFLPMADKMYLTYIKGDFEGDVYYPDFNKSNWREISREDHTPDQANQYPYSFIVFKRC